MGARFYDEAILAKFKKWTENTKVTLTGPTETRRMFEVIADKNNDKPIELPLICVRRPLGYTILQKDNRPMTFGGMTLEANDKKGLLLNAIPIVLNYQVDVYARYYEEADEYMRNLIFNIVNYPMVEIEIPYYDTNRPHLSSIHINTEVEDNSDVPERLMAGQFTRLTLGFTLDDAYLFDVRKNNTCSISDEDVIIIETEITK